MSETSLQDLLQRRNLPHKSLRLSILRLTAAQLDEAHQRRLVHGNLSPQSIFVSEPEDDGAISVRMRDFGSKFVLDPTVSNSFVPPNAYYLSPEQILGTEVNEQSDEFSFAAIAYEMVSGRKAFDAATMSAIIYKICTDDPPPISEIDWTLTSGVSNVFNRALAKSRELRYAGCGAFLAALEGELLRSEGWGSNLHAAVTAPLMREAGYAPRAQPESATAWMGSPVPPVAPVAPAAPNTPPAWARETRFVPIPAEHDLSQVRRRSRYEDEDQEALPASSPVKRIALVGLIVFLLAGAGIFFLNRNAKSGLPTQVLDTKSGPVSPPPTDTSSEAERAQTPAKDSVPQQRPAPPPEVPSQPQPVPEPKTIAPQPQPPAAKPQPRQSARTVSPAPAKRAPTTNARQAGDMADVELLSDPPGANMTVDNNHAATCKAPCTVSLSAGRHTLAAQMGGYTTSQRIFNVPETTSLFIVMSKLTGALVVTSQPSAATILIDGKDYGLTPATLHLPPGQHTVTLMNGSQRHEEVVTVVADGIQAAGYIFPQ
jgi:serine/threonine protein kinase